jgi:quercetin dioxygenase-like cupin family protein
VLVMEKAAGRAAAVEQPERAGPSPSRTRMWPVLAMAAGLALVGAALLVVHSLSGGEAARAQGPYAITLGGPADVTVQSATYEPGQTSGWHSHTGMHAVMVLSGTVTFYDSQCRARSYGPGEIYVGGQDVHVVRNETDEPAELAVTYLFPAGQSHTTFHVDARPAAGCEVR